MDSLKSPEIMILFRSKIHFDKEAYWNSILSAVNKFSTLIHKNLHATITYSKNRPKTLYVLRKIYNQYKVQKYKHLIFLLIYTYKR